MLPSAVCFAAQQWSCTMDLHSIRQPKNFSEQFFRTGESGAGIFFLQAMLIDHTTESQLLVPVHDITWNYRTGT